MYNLTEPIELGIVAGTEYKFYYTLTMFSDRTLAVVIDCENPEFNFREPYSTLTVNLSGYQRFPNEGEIFIHHDSVNTEAFELFYEKFCDKDFGKQPISYGFASSVKVKFADGILPEGIKG